ncbi:MAG: hypothetical protein IIY04_04525 [Oscillospiraceae bacterium]|nr:hypothetical protein [Oscillospiraceae bacterium]
MKHIKKVLALVLALVLLLTPMVSVSAAQTTSDSDELIVFDLEKFLDGFGTDMVKYDFFKFATALQGLVNRDEPQLYFLFSTNYAASNAGYDMDEYWLEKITDGSRGYGELKDGRDLADFKINRSMSFWKIVEKFSSYYNGLVVWQSEVPATANVASTIAGVENLLPVRYAPGGENLYAQLMAHGFTKDDIKRDLCGLFTGEGYIPTLGSSVPGAKLEYTTTPSTQSIKADPYLWAKMFYLDTGLTNPLSLSFSLDAGGDKIRQKADKEASGEEPRFAARLVSAYIPKTMAPGGVSPVKLTFENTGTETWDDAYIRAGIPSGIFGVYTDAECKTFTTSYLDRFASAYCEPGHFYFKFGS